MLDGEINRQEKTDFKKKLMRGVAMSLVVVAAAVILLTNAWMVVLQIDGSSMTPLLTMDEIVCAVRIQSPRRNDVIAFYSNNKIHIKRVIAVSGDRVNIDQNGVVSVNNEVLNEPYVTELSLGKSSVEFPMNVPAGTVFVLGDNRAQSMDSRDIRFGTVEKDQIIGRVFMSLWPISKIGKL